MKMIVEHGESSDFMSRVLYGNTEGPDFRL